MKKLLLTTAAVALGAVAFGSAAEAQGVKLGVGGHMKAYGVWHSQDSEYGVSNRSVDILRTTEAHLTGETTLDNGLTVGAHIEMLIGGNRWDDGEDLRNVQVDESYLYMSGAWGRVNVGNEDGAAYLLQVAAPSADSNIDGIRQFINPFNATGLGGTIDPNTLTVTGDYNQAFFAPTRDVFGLAITAFNVDNTVIAATDYDFFVGQNLFGVDLTGQTRQDAGVGPGEYRFVDAAGDAYVIADAQALVNTRLNVLGAVARMEMRKTDYAQDFVRGDDKVTYLTPVFQGFQAGLSWTPLVGGDTRSFGVRTEDASPYKHAWDFAARYEGQFDQVGLTFGGGYSYARLETDVTAPSFVLGLENDDGGLETYEETIFDEFSLRNYKAWNLGGNVGFQAFNLGVVYARNNQGIRQDADNRKWVVGGDYTTGPFKLGISYLNEKQDLDFVFNTIDLKTTRWSGGLTYTYGPGMTFRGSIHHVDHESAAIRNSDSTSFLLGTQINF